MGITDKISHAAERKAFETIPDGKWAHYTQRLIRENDPYILKTFLTNAAYEGGFRGYQTAQETAEKYDINVPWLILIVSRSCCAIEASTSTRILFTISSTHSCPTGYSIIVVGRSSTLSRIPFSLKYCSSLLVSSLFRLSLSNDLITSVSPRRSRALLRAV